MDRQTAAPESPQSLGSRKHTMTFLGSSHQRTRAPPDIKVPRGPCGDGEAGVATAVP